MTYSLIAPNADTAAISTAVATQAFVTPLWGTEGPARFEEDRIYRRPDAKRIPVSQRLSPSCIRGSV